MVRANRLFVKGLGAYFFMNWLQRLLFVYIKVESILFFFSVPGKFYNINMCVCMTIQSENHCFMNYKTEDQRNSQI